MNEETSQRPQKPNDISLNMQNLNISQTNSENIQQKPNDDFINVTAKQAELIMQNEGISKRLDTLELNLENYQNSINDEFVKLRNEFINFTKVMKLKIN